MTSTSRSGTYVGRAWTCTVRLVLDDPRALRAATEDFVALLARVDAVASHFRPDSALSVANRRAGRPTAVPELLVTLVQAGLDAAEQTDGLVDPALGRPTLGRPALGRPALGSTLGLGAWRSVRLDRAAGLLTVAPGTALDLGASAKAWTADHAAQTLAARYDTAVLVELGGDVAVAGERPDGWCVQVAEREGGAGQLVLVRHGGLTTSTTTVRGSHILDPRTGRPAAAPWRTVSVSAPSALAANTASTAAIVLGAQALDWLTARGRAARLVARDGTVVRTGGWPTEPTPALAGAR